MSKLSLLTSVLLPSFILLLISTVVISCKLGNRDAYRRFDMAYQRAVSKLADSSELKTAPKGYFELLELVERMIKESRESRTLESIKNADAENSSYPIKFSLSRPDMLVLGDEDFSMLRDIAEGHSLTPFADNNAERWILPLAIVGRHLIRSAENDIKHEAPSRRAQGFSKMEATSRICLNLRENNSLLFLTVARDLEMRLFDLYADCICPDDERWQELLSSLCSDYRLKGTVSNHLFRLSQLWQRILQEDIVREYPRNTSLLISEALTDMLRLLTSNDCNNYAIAFTDVADEYLDELFSASGANKFRTLMANTLLALREDAEGVTQRRIEYSDSARIRNSDKTIESTESQMGSRVKSRHSTLE